MQHIAKIGSRFVMFVTIVAFAISTTGFTFYENDCKHSEVQNSILSIDECCTENVEVIVEELQSCCSSELVEQPTSKCGTEYQEGDCCVTEVNYFKLSETYVPSEYDESSSECIILSVDLNSISDVIFDEPEIRLCKEESDVQKLRPPLYRLYNRVKIDPPLI